MPLEIYARGNVWWAKGYVEFNGNRITEYQRRRVIPPESKGLHE